jgi:DNA-binding transcriptional ArsR family regulator
MLRIRFAAEDLGRVRVARRPHALWETVLSLQALQTRQRTVLPGWRDAALARLATPHASAALRILRPLVPARGYFPDFLTPAGGEAIADGIAAVLSTPQRRVAAELELLAAGAGPARYTAVLDPPTSGLGHLGDALAYYHHAALGPYLSRMRALVDADRAVRARALLDGGVETLLATMRPVLRWRPPVLEADYPVEQELSLDGRGLLLVPSVFCERTPITLLDPSLPPTLVYPVGDGGGPDPPGCAGGLAALIGRTRGEVLCRLAEAGAGTGELARLLGISAASASQHASVLRRSGLVVSRRDGSTVVHHITPLGTALLRGGGHPGG